MDSMVFKQFAAQTTSRVRSSIRGHVLRIPLFYGLALAVLAFGFRQAARSAPGSTGLITLDCTANLPSCAEIAIRGDAPDRSMFHGFADPSIRRDPNSGDLFMSYSYPRHLRDTGVNIVDIHLARSADGGKTWDYVGPLFRSRPVSNSQSQGYAADNMSSNEVLDILPVKQQGATAWYTARLVYLVGRGQSFPYTQLMSTSYIAVSLAPTTGNLRNLEQMKEARLGHAGTDSTMKPTLNLADLNPALASCRFFNEPSMVYQDETLFLAVSCGYGAQSLFGVNKPRLDPTKDFFAMLSTKPAGTDPAAWHWKYVGAFALPEEARAVSKQEGRTYDSFTQLEFFRKPDGTVFALLNPQGRSGIASGFRPNPESHFGCRVFQMSPDLNSPSLVKSASGVPLVLARIDGSDLYRGGNAGTGSCSYDPASATGIVMARKLVRDPQQGFISSLHSTGLHP